MYALLATLLLSVHLLAVNVAAGGPLLCVALEWRHTRRSDHAAETLGRRLAWWSWGAAVLGVGLGLLGLGLVFWLGPEVQQRAWRSITPGRWWFIAGEIAFYLAAMGIYAAAWNWFARRRFWHRLLALAAAANLLYHFPPLFATIGAMAFRPSMHDAPLAEIRRPMLLDAEVLSRSVHVALASVAVAAVLLIGLAYRSHRALINEPDHGRGEAYARHARVAAWLALATTLLQVPVGVWTLMALPTAVQHALLGEDAWSMAWFVSSLALSVLLLHQLAAVALGELSGAAIRRVTLVMIAVVVLMTATLVRSRAAGLERTQAAGVRSGPPAAWAASVVSRAGQPLPPAAASPSVSVCRVHRT